ncbi:MAG: hypothetical protein RLZZ326_2864 [Planctomycetota bacterium]
MPHRPGGARIPPGRCFRDGARGQSAFQVQRSCHRAGEAGIGERLRSDEVLRETTKLLPAPPMDHPQARHQRSHRRRFELKLGFGVARVPSPDVRVGHPWPPLTRCRLRSAIHGSAGRQRRLSEHGRPLAGGVERGAFEAALLCRRPGVEPFTVYCKHSRRCGRLAAGPCHERAEKSQRRIVGEELNRAVCHTDVRPLGMEGVERVPPFVR